jgi:ADP-heptose:LPS heptosyltransferase
MLAGTHTITHRRLAELAPAALYSVDPRPQDGAARHITQQWQTQLEQQGLLVPKCIHQRPAHRGLGVPDVLRQRGRELCGTCGNTALGGESAAVVIHPGSGGRPKCWPLSAFVAVARRLKQAQRAAVCFVLGPVEAETWPAREVESLSEQFAVLRCPSADELIAVLAGARVLIGNDAGPTHLAALLGTPTVTIFGPTSASVWRPLGVHAHVITGDPQTQPETWGIQPEQVVSLALKGV